MDDYPAAALRSETEGDVSIRYRLGRDGRPTSCAVVESSNVPVLDAASCALIMARARFIPARDFSGAPVEETRSQTILWRLPGGPGAVVPEFVTGFVAASVPAFSQSGGECSLTATRPELRGLSEDLCGEMAAYLSPSGTKLPTNRLPRTLAIVTVSVAGEALPRQPRPFGTLAYREEARFQVSPDGRVSNCRRQVTQSWTGRQAFDLCRFMATSDAPFFVADLSRTGPVEGRIAILFYSAQRYGDVRSV